jgi:hypothetical protein
VDALYNRQKHIHGVFGGQRQGGISTPKEHPLVIAFTGEAGVSHGYHDFWNDDEVFHYFGEGQVGDMKYVAGNRAIGEHAKDGKTLVVFQMMGKRFLRASHIKPWADSTHSERVDDENGLLLAPHADLLFDRGWISFSSAGRLLISSCLPSDVQVRLGLKLDASLRYRDFSQKQLGFFEFHRRRCL